MKQNLKSRLEDQTSEILILANGNIFVHNLTPTMAGLLAKLNPEDIAMRERARIGVEENIVQTNACANR